MSIQDMKARPKKASELESELLRKTTVKRHVLPGVEGSVDKFREEMVDSFDPALVLDEAENLLKMEAFMNEPVEIMIHRSHEKNFAPNVTDLISINGVPAEVLGPKGWMRMGYLPRGQRIIVKRKVVEVIARCRIDSVNTEVERPMNEDPINRITSTTTYSLPFQLVHDKNTEMGPEWFDKLMNTQV